MELLEWQVSMITPQHFIDYIDTYLRQKYKSWMMSSALEKVRLQTLQNTKLALIHYETLKFKPSEIAFGAF